MEERTGKNGGREEGESVRVNSILVGHEGLKWGSVEREWW